MPNPSVVAILLTADRSEFTRQAVQSFRAQTYENKRLLIYDSSVAEIEWPEDYYEADDICLVENNPIDHHGNRKTIGYLRNRAVAFWTEFPIIVHWDSDDYSHPNRIAEQVALLQSSGADCVGYNEMLFAREMVKRELKEETAFNDIQEYGPATKFQQAWLYSNPNPHYALGTSLAYKREVWERKPFEATSHGEDEKFIRGLKVVSVPSCPPYYGASGMDGTSVTMRQPRMIARIHSSNTSTAYSPRKMEAEARKKDGMWKRVPSWDAYCAETMR